MPIMKKELPLSGLSVVTFESRRAEVMEQLITKQGGRCISAPSMQEIPLEKNQDVFHFAEKLFAGKIDIVICMTGVGTRALIQVMEKKYGLEKTIKHLSIPIISARGPKPIKVLNEYKIPIAIRVPEPNTWRQVIQELDDYREIGSLNGKVVAVQEYGVSNEALVNGLKRRGAHVIQVPVYRWALPDDTRPLKAAIQSILKDEVDVALFTTGNQVHNVIRLAAEEGLEEKVKDAFNRTMVASIGPVCSEALNYHGLNIDLEPERSTMGAFVLEVAKTAKDFIRSRQKPQVHVSSPIIPSLKEAGEVDQAALRDSLLMKALRLEKTERTPVWLMRQAGRYMKEYREIRKKVPFLEFCKNKDMVTEITVKAQEMLKADAAIIFSDILVLVECFGLALEYSRGEGPVIKVSLDEGKSIDDLEDVDVNESLAFVFDAIRQTRGALKKDVPLLGFAGAPFTLASYMIEGGTSKSFQRTKSFMYADKGRWDALMDKISHSLIQYLNGQVQAGVQAVQLFDSWVGCLGPEDYREYVQPFSAKVIRGLDKKVPLIHFGTGTTSLLELMTEAGGEAIGVDYRVSLDEAWKQIGHRKAIQGNLDPLVLHADQALIKKRVQVILDQADGRPGHIFNLGHGILPDTPVDHAKYLVEIVHELSVRK